MGRRVRQGLQTGRFSERPAKNVSFLTEESEFKPPEELAFSPQH